MMTLSTHVLDAALGRPAANVGVRLERGATLIAEARTDADGRVRELAELVAGTYRLTFDTGGWFAATAHNEQQLRAGIVLARDAAVILVTPSRISFPRRSTNRPRSPGSTPSRSCSH